jgi:putative DNA primase/helicase
MADISFIYKDLQPTPPPPETQLIDAIRAAGLEPPDHVTLDGKIHRFKSGTKGAPGHGDKPGWYLAFADGVPAGKFGCWRAGIEQNWRADVGRTVSPAEEAAIAMRIAEAKALRDAAIERQHEVASETVERIWSGAQAAHSDHPYLSRKGIQTHGARTTGDGRLIVPLYSADGELSSLQYIDHAGGKLYHAGGQTGGKFWTLGSMDEHGVIYMAEGFATAATIHETTSRPVVVAYSASNLVPVTGVLRERYGAAQEIVIVADNDKSGVGQRYAEQACAKHGARMVMPPTEGDANDYAQSGGNLAALLNPPVTEWLIPADDLCSQPSPIRWLVKDWLQDDALVMVHGPSGGGKTFVVLDWCLHMAAGMTLWATTRKVKGGTVVYLAGEGHHGLRGRIAAWKQHYKAGKLEMWLSKDGCDLNTPAGYLKVAESIRRLPTMPSVIVVDTLHRFLLGDENSAQDAKGMLDACSNLMRDFGCSVLLVHHTGVSEEAQHRARGSSAWKGALDIEISIVPGKDGAPIQIIQRKSKDAEEAETVLVELQKVEIDGWFDEDGEPITSAVIVESDKPIKAEKANGKIEHSRKTVSNAWWASGAEIFEDKPYISRSALIEYLVTHDGVSEASAKVYVKPSQDGRLISILLGAEYIEASGHGWVITDPAWAGSLMMRKAEG